jgi:hypothetical protein
VLFTDVTALPADRYPIQPTGDEIRMVHERIRAGLDMTAATRPMGKDDAAGMAMSNTMADRDEDFNTRYASYRGWQLAVERVKPIVRSAARLDLSAMVKAAGCRNTADVVDHFGRRYLRVALTAATRAQLIEFLNRELGTSSVDEAQSYMEDPLRVLLHLIMSLPEYQLG